jgi:hypothetical protein
MLNIMRNIIRDFIFRKPDDCNTIWGFLTQLISCIAKNNNNNTQLDHTLHGVIAKPALLDDCAQFSEWL